MVRFVRQNVKFFKINTRFVMKKVKISLLGCGDRGNVYCSYALKNPEEAEVIAVIDVDPVALKTTGDLYGIPNEKRFSCLDDFLAAKIECDRFA